MVLIALLSCSTKEAEFIGVAARVSHHSTAMGIRQLDSLAMDLIDTCPIQLLPLCVRPILRRHLVESFLILANVAVKVVELFNQCLVSISSGRNVYHRLLATPIPR